MPRRREVPKRPITPDPKYGDRQVAKFMNVLMSAGKKSTAERIAYGALEIIAHRLKDESADLVEWSVLDTQHVQINPEPSRDELSLRHQEGPAVRAPSARLLPVRPGVLLESHTRHQA